MTLPPELIPLVGDDCGHFAIRGKCYEKVGNYVGDEVPYCPGYTISQSRVDALVAVVRAVPHLLSEANTCDDPIEHSPGELERCGGCFPCANDQILHMATTLTEQEDAKP